MLVLGSEWMDAVIVQHACIYPCSQAFHGVGRNAWERGYYSPIMERPGMRLACIEFIDDLYQLAPSVISHLFKLHPSLWLLSLSEGYKEDSRDWMELYFTPTHIKPKKPINLAGALIFLHCLATMQTLHYSMYRA